MGCRRWCILPCATPPQTKFTVLEISEALKISKIYLEQVTQLKVEGIVGATKGPQGGYSLKRPPAEITAYEVLAATETSLFDSTPETLGEQAPYLEQVMVEEVFRVLDDKVKETAFQYHPGAAGPEGHRKKHHRAICIIYKTAGQRIQANRCPFARCN